jgi:hypothetical protein
MRKGLLIQFVLMSAALVCSFVLNIMLLSLAVERGDMSYTHVMFSGCFSISSLICLNVLHILKEEKMAEEEQNEQLSC